eukprot:PRCOL_00001914-RA
MATETGSAGGAPGAFEFPPHFAYPPFFTLQPVEQTRARQLSMWTELVLAYCAHARLFVVDADAPPQELFANAALPRKLEPRGVRAVLGALVDAGSGEWIGGGEQKVLVMWRRAEEWASEIESIVHANALAGSVLTLEELTSGVEAQGTPVEGLHIEVLHRALEVLEARGKAVRFKGDSADDEGVKFL